MRAVLPDRGPYHDAGRAQRARECPDDPPARAAANSCRGGPDAADARQPDCGDLHRLPRSGAAVIPAQPGEPAGWLTVGVGTPGGPEDRKSELLGRFCSPECLATALPLIKARLAELPYRPPDERPSSANTVAQLMREVPAGRSR